MSINGKTCGQCRHWAAGFCWFNPPVPTPSGHMIRPAVNVDSRTCGHFGSVVVLAADTAAGAAAGAGLPSPEEVKRIVADMEARGELRVDKTKPPKNAPKGKRAAA